VTARGFPFAFCCMG